MPKKTLPKKPSRKMAMAKPQPAALQRQKAITVLGMHRSGTSAVARIMNLLGVTLGESLVSPGFDNPKGFWEHKEIFELHDKLLSELGSSYDDIRSLPENWWKTDAALRCRLQIAEVLRREFRDAPLWGIKDPRMCRLIKLWHTVFAESRVDPHFIMIFRNPLEVAVSLRKRNGLSFGKSFMLWMEHVLESERETRYLPRCFVSFGRIANDWRSTMMNISENLHIRWPRDLNEVESAVEGFLDVELKHHNIPKDDLVHDHLVPRVVVQLYELLEKADGSDGQHLVANFSTVENKFRDERRTCTSLAFREEIEEQRGYVKQQSVEIHQLNSQISVAESRLSDAAASLRKTELDIERLQEKIQEGGDERESLNKAVQEREARLNDLADAIRVRGAQIVRLQEKIERDGQERESLSQTVRDQEARLHDVAETIRMKEAQIVQLQEKIREYGNKLVFTEAELSSTVKDRDCKFGELNRIIIERDALVIELTDRIRRDGEDIERLTLQLQENELRLMESRERVFELESQLFSVYQTRSWKITAPLRYLRGKVRRNTSK